MVLALARAKSKQTLLILTDPRNPMLLEIAANKASLVDTLRAAGGSHYEKKNWDSAILYPIRKASPVQPSKQIVNKLTFSHLTHLTHLIHINSA